MIVRKIYLPYRLSDTYSGLPYEKKRVIKLCQEMKAEEKEIEPKRSKPIRSQFALAKGNILIVKSQRQLTLFDGNKPLRQFKIAIGKPSAPTPVGKYSIATKIANPGGVLGSRWMGLNYDSYGIHGTNAPWSIGKMVSNGCIRMHNSNVEEVFALVRVGTPVYIRD
ncbi:L,D-transpeptidase [Selenomonadales bacterium OttesenSCG-928-I06]|nr:L,D-transpeptidase [Selenomonadales bacterium OttesenSCG-928-I06]